MYRTPTARLLAKKNTTTTTARLGSSSTKKKTIAGPVGVTPQHDPSIPAKEQLRAQLLENQHCFLSYMASVVEALRQENATLREKHEQAVDENNKLSRAIAGAKQYLGGGGGGEGVEVLPATPNSTLASAPSGKQSNNTTFKPKNNACISDFIVGDEVNGFRCGVCLQQHGDAKVYWDNRSCYAHIRDIHKVQPKKHLPLPIVRYDPKKWGSKQFFEQVGPDQWKCKACAGAGREVVVKGCSTSVHLKLVHMRKTKK